MTAGLISRILAGWRAPGQTVRSLRGLSEAALLATLMGTMAVYLLAQWPGHARAARLDPTIPADARMAGAVMGTMFLMPLVVYALAALSDLVMGWAGRPVSGADSRLAIIWALALVAPLMLLSGIVQGLAGPGAVQSLVSGAAGVAFLVFWVLHLRALAGAVGR